MPLRHYKLTSGFPLGRGPFGEERSHINVGRSAFANLVIRHVRRCPTYRPAAFFNKVPRREVVAARREGFHRE